MGRLSDRLTSLAEGVTTQLRGVTSYGKGGCQVRITSRKKSGVLFHAGRLERAEDGQGRRMEAGGGWTWKRAEDG